MSLEFECGIDHFNAACSDQHEKSKTETITKPNYAPDGSAMLANGSSVRNYDNLVFALQSMF